MEIRNGPAGRNYTTVGMASAWILLWLLHSVFANERGVTDILQTLDALETAVRQNGNHLVSIQSENDDQALQRVVLENDFKTFRTNIKVLKHAVDTTPGTKKGLTRSRESTRWPGEIKERRHRSVSDLTGATSGVYHRVAFTAAIPMNGTQLVSDANPIIFQQVDLNIRHGYDPTTGIFVTPVPGVYLFTVAALSQEGYHCSLELVRNGKGVATLRAEAVPHRRDQGTITVLLRLEELDKVFVRGYNSNGVSLWGDKHTVFTGVMLWALA